MSDKKRKRQMERAGGEEERQARRCGLYDVWFPTLICEVVYGQGSDGGVELLRSTQMQMRKRRRVVQLWLESEDGIDERIMQVQRCFLQTGQGRRLVVWKG